MTRFISRISINYEFASERMELLGSFWKEIEDALPEDCNAKMGVYRFTFAIFFLDGNTEEDCRKNLTYAWNKAFGDISAVSDMFFAEYDEKNNEDISALMRAVFVAYYGVDDYIRLAEELNKSIPLFADNDALDVIRKTSIVFAMDPGCGFTTLISSYANFLMRQGVYGEESGKRTGYYEVILGDELKDGRMDADTLVQRLIDNLDNNTYGIVGIDVSAFLEKNRQDKLRDFLRRLDSFRDDYVFAFRIPFLEKSSLDDAISLLSDQMIVKTVAVPPFHDCVLMEVFWNILNDKGFSVDTGIFDLISGKIRQEKKDGRFYGFKSVFKIAGEVMLKKAAGISEKSAKGEEYSLTVTTGDLVGYVDEKALENKGYESLYEMIGMEKITERIKEIIAQVKFSMGDEKLDRPSIHMRFTGAPGTGKTTVARIIGQIMKEEGILRKGAFLEYTGRDLVAEFVGQTAVKTSSICRDSYGSVLFIDEAYSLYASDQSKNDFGKEALTTLVSEMENHRDDMLIVMAGYTDEMDELMKGNPGLRSRMPYIIDFPNYTKEQLFEIYMLMVRKHFEYTDELKEEAYNYFMSISDSTLSSKEFANARFVRNLYERTWSKGALRAQLAGRGKVVLDRDDFIAASSEKEFSEKLTIKTRLGFY
ncbi:MAG: AAA family ATPase [Lachnospiraceae bacterium]|nr:AAA family ATPase [Lachnospiraceae bacterium]